MGLTNFKRGRLVGNRAANVPLNWAISYSTTQENPSNDTAIEGGVASLGVVSGGAYFPDPFGLVGATTNITGTGSGVEFAVSGASGQVDTILAIGAAGTGYAIGDTFTAVIDGSLIDAVFIVLSVTSI